MTDKQRPLGFWTCWALTVGTMIGSGIFLLPSVLAPYGLLSFGGWIIAGLGAVLIALVFARLAARTKRSGGPYVYVQEAFGDLPGFLIAWIFWVSFWTGIPVVAIAFAGYLGVLFPVLAAPAAQASSALALIAALTLVNVRGLREAGLMQLLTALLKILPLIGIALLAVATGDPDNLPPVNPSNGSILSVLSATALIAVWAFTGFEACTLPASSVVDPERTIPRALITGVITVTIIYLGATAAVMLLLPPGQLVSSAAPFADAARGFGPWGPPLVAVGALVATAGTLNGLIFVCGQIPMAVALDKLAPSWLGHTNKGDAPHFALILSAMLGSVLLLLNYSRGMIGAFTFLLMMSTALGLIYYVVTALADVRHSWRTAPFWAAIALAAAAFALFAIFGSGLEVFGWGMLLTACGVPLYFIFARNRAAQISGTAAE